MSAIHNSLLLPFFPPIQTQHSVTDTGPGRIVFTRQVWQRNMPDENQGEQGVSNKSHAPDSHVIHISAAGPSRRPSSTPSTRSQRRSPSPARESKTPLTPEESPPFRTTRKRNASTAELEDKELEGANTTPAHSRASSGDSTAHVCICQPDPKIPRPRNGMYFLTPHDSLLRLMFCSLHLISSALSSHRCRPASRSCEPRDLQDHRRAVAKSAT